MRNKIESASALTLLSLALIVLPLSTGSTAATQDQPTVAKDSVQATAFTVGSYRNNADMWSWVPRIEFRVNGPIASGSQLYAEFNIAGTGPWVKFDCRTEEREKGYSWKTECGGRDIPEDKGSTYTGPVGFAINAQRAGRHRRDALQRQGEGRESPL